MVKGEELEAILANSQAKIFISHYDCFKSLKPRRSEMPFLKEIVLTNPPDGIREARSFAGLLEKGTNQFSAIEVERKDPAVIVYTSGTTGRPKGAVFTHGCLLRRVQMGRSGLEELSQGDRMLTVAPLSSSMGISGVMISAFLNGATVYLHERFDAEEYVKTIRQEKITIIKTVPTVYFVINGLPNVGKEDFQSLRFAGSSGAFLPSEVRRRFAEISGVEITQYYGCTEAGRPLARDPAEKNKRQLGSVGQVLPDVQMKILGPDGRQMPPGEVGEVCFRFPGQMIGYWNLPEETKKTLRNGWVHTGDIGKLDTDGFLYLQDRKADRMIVGGYNVYPAEIENVLHQDPRVAEAAVIGVRDERLGEIPMAFVVLRKGLNVTEEELVNLTREKLAKYKALRRVQFVENIPKNPIGKVLKKVLRNQYLAKEKSLPGDAKKGRERG
jgi:long-chain acyl-CoA synthetase